MSECKADCRKRDWARLTSSQLGITIHGEIEITEDHCAIEGTINGCTTNTAYNFNPLDLAGHSTLHRAVWFERVYLCNVTLDSGDANLPRAIRLFAYDMYSGAFDPRVTPIESASLPLTDMLPLAIHDPKEAFDSKYFEETLAEDDGASVVLSGLFEDNFNLTQQWIGVRLGTPGSHAYARGVLERTIALLCFLTRSTLQTSLIKFQSGRLDAEHWRSGGLRHRTTSWNEWLYRPGSILEELKRMLPGWLRATAPPNIAHQTQVLLGAPGRETLEGLFLTYCQCFEDLNGLRRPSLRFMSEDAFERDVIDVLKPHIKPLGTKPLRKQLISALRDANHARLETRIEQAFSKSPPWMWQIFESMPQIARDIALRRNQLAHGDPAGAVRSADAASVVGIQTDVMALYCVTELFLLALHDEDAALAAAAKDPRVSHLLYRVARYKPTDTPVSLPMDGEGI